MRRCPACGGFFKGDACPNTSHHEQDSVLLGPLPPIEHAPMLVGSTVWCDWPGHDKLVPCLIATNPDEDGMVELMVISGNIRRNLDDLHMTGDQ